MFIISVTYKVAISIIDTYLAAHRQFLDAGYKNNVFLASGPKNPRIGGIIISLLSDKAQLIEVMKNDPFVIHDLVDFDVIAFEPTRYHPLLKDFLNQG